MSWKQLRPHASNHPEARYDVHVQFAAFTASPTGLPGTDTRDTADRREDEDADGARSAATVIALEVSTEFNERLGRGQRAGGSESLQTRISEPTIPRMEKLQGDGQHPESLERQGGLRVRKGQQEEREDRRGVDRQCGASEDPKGRAERGQHWSRVQWPMENLQAPWPGQLERP